MLKIMIVERWSLLPSLLLIIWWTSAWRTQSNSSLSDQEESGPLTKPHLPLTAMTKASAEAPSVPQSPASVAKAAKETPVKSVDSSAKCGEWKMYFSCVINVSLHLFDTTEAQSLLCLCNQIPFSKFQLPPNAAVFCYVSSKVGTLHGDE